MSKSKYDHNKKHVLEAVGISKERMDEIEEKLIEFLNEPNSVSETVEKCEKEFEPKELAFFFTTTYMKLREIEKLIHLRKKAEEVQKMFSEDMQSRRGEKKEKEKGGIPFMMGTTGEA